VQTVIVLAKAPVPGRTKTRLCPPCTPSAAAALASASLLDTADAVERWGGERLLVLDACGTDFRLDGWPTVAQSDGDLGARLDAAFAASFSRVEPGSAVFLVGMDTPQLSVDDLLAAFEALERTDVVIGAAVDGGYWGIGMRAYLPGAFDDVPMSTDSTFAVQLSRLAVLGVQVAQLRTLQDVDTFDDARAVGRKWPDTRVGGLVASPNWWLRATPPGAGGSVTPPGG
jgi:uncharacterized protein